MSFLHSFSLDFDSLAGAFCFVSTADKLKSHFSNSFTPCLDSSMYSSLAMMTCIIWGTYIWWYLLVFELYHISILCNTF